MKRILPFLLFLACALCFAQFTDGSGSHIKAKDLAKLRSFRKMKFLVPTWVPKGFKVASSTFEEEKDPATLSWVLTYTNAKTHSRFVVQMCSEGIGDVMFTLPSGDTVDPTGHLKFENPTVGKGDLEVYAKGKERQWQINWIELKSKPVFVSAMGYGMSGSDGKKIVESLRWLK